MDLIEEIVELNEKNVEQLVKERIQNEAKHENVKAMTDAVHKYGIYRK